MDVIGAIRERRSVRAYQNKEIPEEVLQEVLNTARLAPSASNRQDWQFVVVQDNETRKELARVSNNQKFVDEAPAVIVAVSLNPQRIMSCQVPAYAVDLAIAMDHITLAAVEKGLGTCWIGAFSQEEVKRLMDIPDKFKVVALMPIGYPADKSGNKLRKDFEQVISVEKFNQDLIR